MTSATLEREATSKLRRPVVTHDPVVDVPVEDAQRYLFEAIDGLRLRHPELSAHEVFSRGQKRFAAAIGVLTVVGMVVDSLATLHAILGLVTLIYVAAVWYRLACFRRGIRHGNTVRVPDAVAQELLASELPRYTILVPAYNEPEVVPRLLKEIASIDYPRSRLEVLVLLEEDDTATLDAVRRARPARYVRVVLVPPSVPRTKPKACNYGLQIATGDYVTIYDAEDRPEPLQLRRAVAAFAHVPEKVVCLQAMLGYYNSKQNRLTSWFTTEYLTWFSHFLPGLASLQAPIPLGGTSNHMRTEVLRELGGWDSFNVTEDADLGIRLHRKGMRTMVLDSRTGEEANSDFVNWIKQRSRWYKGYFQTWLVHMRQPVRTYREIGWRGMLGLNLFVGGTPTLALLNPLFWTLTLVWFIAKPHWILQLFPGPLYFPAMVCWIFGNLAVLYMGFYSLRTDERPDLLAAAATLPAYWVMMAIAAVKAFAQLVHAPSFWEKTMHGLSGRHGAATDVAK